MKGIAGLRKLILDTVSSNIGQISDEIFGILSFRFKNGKMVEVKGHRIGFAPVMDPRDTYYDLLNDMGLIGACNDEDGKRIVYLNEKALEIYDSIHNEKRFLEEYSPRS